MIEPHSASRTYWSPLKKISFRFSFILILAFIIFMNNGAFPMFAMIMRPVMNLVYRFIPWFSEHILHYQYDFKIFPNGSGDTSFSWVLLLFMAIASGVGALLWSILDRKRASYNDCYYWLTVVIRYYLACMLINYGALKMMHAQMPAPSLHRLMEPLGEFSPMGLAWTYLGYSSEYSFFVGLVEVLSAFLFFRKTVVLGALITAATAINVMTVNYFFDVPVKLLSTALFLLSLFLLLPYLKTMYGLFFKGTVAKLTADRNTIFLIKRRRTMLYVLKGAFLLLFMSTQVTSLLATRRFMQQYLKQSPLHGIYRIKPTQSTQKSIPSNWRSIIFEFEGNATIRDSDYQAIHETIAIDTAAHTLSLHNFTFNYKLEANADVTLWRSFENEIEEIKLIKIDPESFELKKQGFRWIQEYPNNR